MPKIAFKAESVALLISSYLHIFLAPFTKVEESFSLQAIHDILACGIGSSARLKFDHITFTGAVPRSFFGPTCLSIISYPILALLKSFHLIQNSAHAGLVLRLILTTLHAVSVIVFANLVIRNRLTKRFFFLLYSIQFHPLFWAGRTTPNGIILPIVNLALAFSLADSRSNTRKYAGLFLLTVSAVIARLEIVGLIIPIALMIASDGIRSFVKVAQTGLSAGIFALAISVPLDTYMWGRPFHLWNPLNLNSVKGYAWPELEAILFNVVEGKSSEWGVSSWHAYITQHIAKLISIPCILLFFGGIAISFRSNSNSDPKPLKALVVIVSHVAIMSCLGHKETRFITYLTPLLNLYAAKGAAAIWQGIGKIRYHLLLGRMFVCMLLAGTILLTGMSLYASAGNYPGGEALKALHNLIPDQNATVVHIDVLPAMTGVSLFQSINLAQRSQTGAFGLNALPNVLAGNTNVWVYDKTEEIFKAGGTKDGFDPLISTFTHLLSDQQDCHLPSLFKPMMQDGEPISFSEFGHISIQKSLPPLVFNWREAVWLCQRRHI
ncbi:uncharacterized protein FA14DRAFT_175171 [Meira miltonrushii]|uniref:Mannosyltransferase n=1 Tax=Meira miltonrushii TaxID=1280837 RepID=A0A316V492_9BASI|nr:uncharacterized protein FA14DRAFT_175171 [Meira miltonrushii]PWN32366.1 hypothetical protein FA14DRAFT_175171 [Meira miltonrushii]